MSSQSLECRCRPPKVRRNQEGCNGVSLWQSWGQFSGQCHWTQGSGQVCLLRCPWSNDLKRFVQERKGYININKFFRWLPGWGGSPDRVARAQTFMCCVRNPRNINSFIRVPGREDRWPGWPRNYFAPNVYVPFLAPRFVLGEKVPNFSKIFPGFWNFFGTPRKHPETFFRKAQLS